MIAAPFALPGGLAAALGASHCGVSLHWLGQAGFLLRRDDEVLLIDPYLSDSLREKYRGGPLAYERMMPAPIAPDAIPRVDLVLCTHRHSDHMDPGTLPILAQRHPTCRFVVPAAERARARALGLPEERLIAATADHRFAPLAGLSVAPVTAAHETIERDGDGHDHYLGYAITLGDVRLYHSGDCVPYPGLAERVRALSPTFALLPVNGRDRARAASGIPGNFDLDEAISLCRQAAIPDMIAHHWGMFAFNTLDAEIISARAATERTPRVLRPTTGQGYRLA